MMTRFAAEELIIMPQSIRENNFTEKGTIIQFHKTTSPIPAHDTDIRKMHDNGKYGHSRSNMIRSNNIGSMKLLHHHSTGTSLRSRFRIITRLQKHDCQGHTTKDPHKVTTCYPLHSRLVVRVSVEDRLSVLIVNRLKLLILHVLVQRWCRCDRSIYLHTIIIGHDHLRSHL